MYRYRPSLGLSRFIFAYPNYIISSFGLLLLFTAMGYFVYGGIEGSLMIFILCMLYEIALLLSFIPFLGFAIQGLLMRYFIDPFVFSLTRLHWSWLTSIIFWAYIILGFIITLATTLLVVASERRW